MSLPPLRLLSGQCAPEAAGATCCGAACCRQARWGCWAAHSTTCGGGQAGTAWPVCRGPDQPIPPPLRVCVASCVAVGQTLHPSKPASKPLREAFLPPPPQEVSALAREGRFDYLVIESTGISEPQQVRNVWLQHL